MKQMFAKTPRVHVAIVVAAIFLVAVVAGCGGKSSTGPADGKQAVSLNISTAGDTNMVELQKEAVLPAYKQKNPNLNVSATVFGTGTGDAGSRNIYTKLKAQKEAGKDKWDIDVAIVHQSIMADLIKDDLLYKYVPQTGIAAQVVSANSKNSLGTPVDGYVIPLFQSQVALAYNPDLMATPPKSFAELVDWIKANPKKFGYNGIKGGMSGVGFAAGYVYWRTGKYDTYAKGPYDKANEAEWPAIIKELKALPVTITNGNNGTLDMLNRGEIAAGAVWVDMFYLWVGEGRMNPKTRLKLIDPGLPGQPMYIVIPKNAANRDAAVKYAEFLASPQVQGDFIVARNNWYPGIDANAVLPAVSPQAKERLFKDISAEDLQKRSLSFPLEQYLKDLIGAFEEN